MDDLTNELSRAPSEEEQLRVLLAAMEAASQGDFSHRLPVHGTHALMDRLALAFNTMADQCAGVAAEVTRVAREVGAEGKLGAQADMRGKTGVWKELTACVNALASSLTRQVRDLSQVAGAVARGDLSQKVTAEVRGESLALKNIVNHMVDQLSAFAAEVTRVSKEVAREGKPISQTDFQGMTGVWKDLSDNVVVTEQLALASRYKSEFLASMSHELRTPLNSLLILARVLSENKERHLSPKEVEYARTILASGTDLLHLINDILDLSKVEAGKMRVELSEVLLADVKEFVERSFRHVAEQKGLGFGVIIEAGLPAGLRTDPLRLQQVLKNLLSNAFKFTDSGRVELLIREVDRQHRRFESEALEQAERVVAFSVVDTGIGIAEDKQQLIFEAFQQADGTTSRKYGGTGLGLSISRAMSALLGGELHVESQPGQGSTFTLYLPQHYTPQEEDPREPEQRMVPSPSMAPLIPSTQAPWPDARLEGRKVLVVDDDIRNIFALTSVLESRGMEVLHAEDGKAGIEALRAHPEVDAVLMDVMMPELDGYQAIQAIRMEPRFARLPIIAVTARALLGDREKSLAAGASDYLPKPVDTDRLLELLRHWLQEGPRG